MGVLRSPLSKYYFLILVLTWFTLICLAVLFLGNRDSLSSIVPTVSWHQDPIAAITPTLPRCAGQNAIRELEARWGRAALRMSLAHGGSGARLQRVLRRFRREKKITVGVAGGSITWGHGLDVNKDKSWPTLLEEGLKKVYPDAEISVHNGAVPATGTDYFSSCYEHHVPKDSDLFILESAVNDLMIEDVGQTDSHRPDVIDDTERLVRNLRSSPRDPALMMLSTWILPQDYVNGADRHAIISEYYDIPRISMRSFLYPYLSQHRDEIPKFWGSLTNDHPIQMGHRYMADIVLYHIITEDCFAEELDVVEPYPELSGSELDHSLDPFALPPLRVKQHLDQEPYAESRPFCSSANVRLEGNVAQLQPSEQTGWEEGEWNDKHYWTSTKAGSRITFSDIVIHGTSKLSVYYFRSNYMGLGNMRCWPDDAEDKAVKLQGFWQFVNVGSVGLVAEGLAPGNHSLTCTVLDETEDHRVEQACIWTLGFVVTLVAFLAARDPPTEIRGANKPPILSAEGGSSITER